MRRLLANKITAGLMAAVMVTGAISGFEGLVRADETQTQQEGLWITEIYQNDIKRNSISSAYQPINTYSVADDLMEFVELTNNSDSAISLSDYKLFYESGSNKSELKITKIDGSEDITIGAGESVVIWNYRSDLADYPTIEEFRADMEVDDEATVLITEFAANWKENNAAFRLTKDDETFSYYFYNKVTNDVTADGFAVALKVPSKGTSMEVYESITMPTPGLAYSGQTNATVNVPEDTTPEGVYITEILPNDATRAQYAGTSEVMECLEIVNTNDHDITLKDYDLVYYVKEGNEKILPLTNSDFSESDLVIPAGKTAVIWCYRAGIEGFKYDAYPSEEDFRAALNIDDTTPVYIFNNQNGLNNTLRGFKLYKKSETDRELVSYYIWNGTSDMSNGKSVSLRVNPEGPEMLISAVKTSPSMGVVSQDQITYIIDDGSSMTITSTGDVPESVWQGEDINASFILEDSTLPRKNVTLFYRFDGEGEWNTIVETKQRVATMYFAGISADEIFGHKYVEFYVQANNAYRGTVTETYRVEVNQLNEVDGIRTNISDDENVSGTINITANDGSTNANTTIAIDGVTVDTKPMLENGAYFSFSTADRSNYFRNALVSENNEIIASLTSWRDLNGKAIHIENQYFTYNESTDTYDVNLKILAGTQGTPFEDIYQPNVNREDFNVTALKMVLANGNEYLPVLIGPDNEATNVKTNLSTAIDAIHYIGDSAGWNPTLEVSFSIPAAEVTSVGYELDTTTLSEGNHTLTVSDGGENTKTVNFVVDNTAPVINTGISAGSILSGNININPEVTDNNSVKIWYTYLDGEMINIPYQTLAGNMTVGEHLLEVYACDSAGNETSTAIQFNVSDVSMEVIDSESTASDITADLVVNMGDKNAEGATVTYYEASKVVAENINSTTVNTDTPYIQYEIEVGNLTATDVVDIDWTGTVTNVKSGHNIHMYAKNLTDNSWDSLGEADENGNIKASFEAKDYVANGKVTVVLQSTADDSIPEVDENAAAANEETVWDGNGIPSDYDFSMAWITDTQFYAETYQNHFINMNQWIVDNMDELNIKYVMHTGDIVDEYDMIYEWENANEAMNIFDKAGLAYGVLAGNHDVAGGRDLYENYTNYFGEDRFTSQETYGGSYENNKGHYDLITEGGQDLILLYMSWDIYEDEINWMNEVLQKYSDRKAIILLHRYTNVKETTTGTYLDYAGVELQQSVVAANPNVIAVLNGHYHGSSYETVQFDDDGDGVKERTVYQICTDYQSGFEGGSEYIKMLYFDFDSNKIYVNAYSPYLNDYNYYDTELVELNTEGQRATSVDAVTLDVNFNTDVEIVTATDIEVAIKTQNELGKAVVTGNKATLTLENLKAETTYSWYAKIDNQLGGSTETAVYSVTTKATEIQPETEPETETATDNTEGDNNETTEEIRNPEVEGDVEDDNVADGAGDKDTETGDSSRVAVGFLTALAAGMVFLYELYEILRKKKKTESN